MPNAALNAISPRTQRSWLPLFLVVTVLTGVSLDADAEESAPTRPKPSTAPSRSEQQQAGTDRGSRFRTYDFSADEVCPFCWITPEHPAGRRGLHWHDHWAAVGTAEYVATLALFATAASFELFVEPDQEADWTGPILFDGFSRDALALGTPSARTAAKNVSDGLFAWSVIHPNLIDTMIVTWWAREAPRVAWQMFVINAQAYALTLSLNTATKRITSRARPYTSRCENGGDPEDFNCESTDRFRSFYSGHAAVTATGAGLICAHHTQLSLYKNDVFDAASCVTAVLGTGITGIMRIASDRHWASDVLTGHLMGYISGYLLPTLLYYKEFRIKPEADHEHPAPPDAAPTYAVLPLLSPNSLQLSVLGLF